MRQPQQKSRSRGRGRKPQNPLSRNYESNGPDVKIRGNASHIADKYTTLARDAQSNGDTVMAENYFQHAEHYNRILAAAQAQQQQQQAARNDENPSANGKGPQPQVNAPANENVDVDASDEDRSDADREEFNDQDVNSKAEDDGAKRRPRKTTRKAQATEETASEAAPESEEPRDIEAMTDDAAKLPESITGTLVAE